MKCAGIAQSVERRTENPCVPGSIPGPGNSFIDFLIYPSRVDSTLSTMRISGIRANRYFVGFVSGHLYEKH